MCIFAATLKRCDHLLSFQVITSLPGVVQHLPYSVFHLGHLWCQLGPHALSIKKKERHLHGNHWEKCANWAEKIASLWTLIRTQLYPLSSPSMIEGTNLTVLTSICLWSKHVRGQSPQEWLKVITGHVILGGRCIFLRQCTKWTVWQSLSTALTAERRGHGRTSGLVGWMMRYYSPAAASVLSYVLVLRNQQHQSAICSVKSCCKHILHNRKTRNTAHLY